MGDLVFRTGPGTKLDAAVLKTKVASAVNGVSPGWSVLVRGHREELLDHDTQVRARTLLGNDRPAGARYQLVRIRAEQMTGRATRQLSGASAPYRRTRSPTCATRATPGAP